MLADDFPYQLWPKPLPHGDPDADRLMRHAASIFKREGLSVRWHYAYRLCAPSRASILSGRSTPHIDNLLDGWMCSGVGPGVKTMGENLKANGFRTHWIGKSHAGMATDAYVPGGRGFDTAMGFFGVGIVR